MNEHVGSVDLLRKRFTSIGTVNGFVRLFGLSTFGRGLVYPYTAIYLASSTQIGERGAAAYYGVLAIATLCSAGAVAVGGRRVAQPRTLTLAGVGMSAVGFAGLSLATALPAVVLLAILVGAGDGLFNAGVVPTLSATTGVEAHREVFARYNRALNAGMGVGAVVSGLLATLGGVGIVRALFVVAGVLFVPLALCVARMPAEDLVDNAEHNLDRGWGAAGGWRLLRVAATPILVQFAAFFLIFSQFEATAPLVARNLMHTVVYATPLMLVANTVAIVVLQSSVTAFVRRWKETTVLAACMALWCAGYLAAALCSPGPGAVRVVALVVLALIIAIGECMYACSFNPWLIRRVNQVDLPRVSAACSAALSLGAAVGPVFGVTLVAVGGSAVLVWLVLAGGCLAGCAATAGIAVRDRRALVPAESGATQ